MSLRVVSLFAGVGGADMGLYAAARDLGLELEVVLAVECDPKAVAIYNANLPHPSAVVGDVKAMTRADLPPHDLVIGGPPCQDHSLAGKRGCQCHLGGPVSPRCCIRDFLRLADGSPYLMENVVSRLVPSVPYSVKLSAFHFGDVTTRKRWFYSTHLLHVIETPGPRRFGDIRDHDADRLALEKRGRVGAMEKVSPYADADAFPSLTAHAWHGHDTRSATKLVEVPKGITHRPRINQQPGCEPYATFVEEAGAFGSLTADAPHNTVTEPLVRGRGRKGLTAMDAGEPFDGLTGESWHRGGLLKVGLRGHSASAFDDDEPIGSLIANSWHGNELSRLGPTVRCPSLLEMQRAHSFPDDFDWCGATKTAKGRYIANSWPIKLAEAVCRAMLVALMVQECVA